MQGREAFPVLEQPEIPQKNSWNPGHIYCRYEKWLAFKCQEQLLALEIQQCMSPNQAPASQQTTSLWKEKCHRKTMSLPL